MNQFSYSRLSLVVVHSENLTQHFLVGHVGVLIRFYFIFFTISYLQPDDISQVCCTNTERQSEAAPRVYKPKMSRDGGGSDYTRELSRCFCSLVVWRGKPPVILKGRRRKFELHAALTENHPKTGSNMQKAGSMKMFAQFFFYVCRSKENVHYCTDTQLNVLF